MSTAKDDAEGTAPVADQATATSDLVTHESAESSGPAGPLGGAERRKKPRHNVALRVTMVGEHNFYLGLSENLSEGGLFVATHDILPIGTPIRVDLRLPTSRDLLSVDGEVRWVRSPDAVGDTGSNFGSGSDASVKPGMGIQFRDTSPEVTRAIEKFMKHRKPEFFDE